MQTLCLVGGYHPDSSTADPKLHDAGRKSESEKMPKLCAGYSVTRNSPRSPCEESGATQTWKGPGSVTSCPRWL